MDYDFIRFGWPNMSFIAALAIIPIAVALVTPTVSVTRAQASAPPVSMPLAAEAVIFD